MERDALRGHTERIVEQREMYTLQTVDHGQIVMCEGDHSVETAKTDILRVGSHSKCGFGEF